MSKIKQWRAWNSSDYWLCNWQLYSQSFRFSRKCNSENSNKIKSQNNNESESLFCFHFTLLQCLVFDWIKILKCLIKTQFKNKSIRNKWKTNWYFTSGITELNNKERPLRRFSGDAKTARLISFRGDENNYPQQMNRSLIDPKLQLFLNKQTTCSNWALCGSRSSDAQTDAADLEQPVHSQGPKAELKPTAPHSRRIGSLEGRHALLWLCCPQQNIMYC